MVPKRNSKRSATRESKPWARRIVGHADVPAKSIMPHPLNYRIHPDTQEAAVSEAISRLGWIEEVMVNKITGRLLNGHLRVRLAAQRDENVPISYVELSEDEERLALASIDPLSGLAVQDSEKLSELLAGLELDNPNSVLDTFLNAEAESVLLSSLFDEGAGSSSPADGRSHLQRQPNITIVIALKDLALFEEAILATGLKNRGEAIAQICRTYVSQERQFDLSA